MRKDPKLKRLYLRLNKKWFGNKLPRDTRVGWEPRLNHEPFQAELLHDEEPLGIIHNPHLRRFPNLIEYNMLHEMAHIATIGEVPPHGPKWQREMLRLAKAGAFRYCW